MVAPVIAAAAISAGANILGGLFGASSAKKQAKQAQAQFDAQMAYMRQRDQANDAFSQQIFDMVPGFLDKTNQQDAYYRQFNQDQQDAALELMNYLRGWDSVNYGNQQESYDYQKTAQAFRDLAAQENRDYQLRQIAQNQRLSQQERDFAISQLQRAQGLAASERATEGQDIAATQATKAQEYQDRYSRLMQDRIAAASEREYERNKQDLIISQAAKMRDNVQRVLAEQGTLRAPTLLGPEDIAAEAMRRGQNYTDIMDKLSERQMSQLEASLMRRGMQTGADSAEQRAELTARLAPEYQKALLTAENEAASVVEGKNKTLTDRFNALRQAREIALNEAQLGEGAGLDLISRLGSVQSGILDRNVGSASDYIPRRSSELNVQGPVSIGSGIYDNIQPSDGIAQFIGTYDRRVNPSNQGMGYDIQSLPNYDIGGLLNASISARGGSSGASILDQLGQRSQAAGLASGAAQQGLSRTIDSVFSKGLDWLGNQKDWSFFGGSKSTPSLSSSNPTRII